MKPLADHGTTARAKGRPSQGIKGCPCPRCRAAERRYDKRRRYLNETGRTLMVDAAPVAQHIRNLLDAGAGWVQLAAITGSSTATISHIVNGKTPEIRRVTANKFLAVQPGDAIPPHRPVPAIGSTRRIHALMARGHACKTISAATTVDHSLISDLVNERLTTISRSVADRITTGYHLLAATEGTSARSRNRARRNGWQDTAYWDDVDRIDDPTFDPDATTPRYVQLAEDGLELIEQHRVPREHAAARLGVTKTNLDAAIRRYRRALATAA